MRFSLRILLLLFLAAIFLAGWVGNTRRAAIKRATALNQLMESGVTIKHGEEETFSTYWFEEEAMPPVVSIEQATQEIETESHESLFDFVHIPELEKLVLFNDQHLSPESSKALVNLRVLEFRNARASLIYHEWNYYILTVSTDSIYGKENRYRPADDDLVSNYANSLPVMPELQSLSVIGYVENLRRPSLIPHDSKNNLIEGDWIAGEKEGEEMREFTDSLADEIAESGELDSFQGRWIKGSDLHTFLKKAPNLKNLEIALYEVTPEAISALGELTTLESVNINLWNASPEVYFQLTQELLGLPNLKSLEVEYPRNVHMENLTHFLGPDGMEMAHLRRRDAFLQELNNFETLTLSHSKLESISLSHIAKLKVVDCPNLKTISSFDASGQASLTAKRCDKLEKISVLALDLHCEDCPSLVGTFQKGLNLDSRKMFFKNVGAIKSLEIDSLDDLTVEGELKIDIGTEFKIGDSSSPVRAPGEIEPAESNTPIPSVSCKKLVLESLSPAIIELMKQNGPLDSVEFRLSGESPADQTARGWTPGNMTAFFQQVSVKHLAISARHSFAARHSFEENCFEQLHQCKCESLEFKARLYLSGFLASKEELPLAQRWSLKLPETLKTLKVQYSNSPSNNIDEKPMEFLAGQRPDIKITFWWNDGRGSVYQKTIGGLNTN